MEEERNASKLAPISNANGTKKGTPIKRWNGMAIRPFTSNFFASKPLRKLCKSGAKSKDKAADPTQTSIDSKTNMALISTRFAPRTVSKADSFLPDTKEEKDAIPKMRANPTKASPTNRHKEETNALDKEENEFLNA